MPESFEFEHYQLLKNADGSFAELGRGAMGITYKAFDTSLRCNVALKVISGSLLEDERVAERFLREARSAAQLRHRNVASVFHLGRHGTRYFYAMEFIDGETVDALVKRNGPLECLFALDIAQQVASALMAAERQHLVHRDIKPSNLMLVREGDGEILVKVIDFGLARSAVMQSTTTGEITSGGFVGTPYFASPEQLDRQTEDIRSDIYSLGVTLWYMLLGKPTFTGSVASVIAQHLDKSPPFEALAILPAEVVAVLRKMLEKDREQRVQTPLELRNELKACIERLRSLQTSVKPETTEWNFDTIALSNTNAARLRPEAGWQLKDRYRLVEDINPANPARTFYAEDLASKTRVTVRIFHADPALLNQIEEDAKRIQRVAHPNFLKVFAVEREKNFSFAVLEWLEGFPLVDLLRARRALTLRETRMLLKQIVAAVDEARAANLTLEMNLRDILVHFPEGFAALSADVVLHCPLDEWPAFVVKLDALGKAKELESSATRFGERPSVGTQTPHHDIIQLGIVAYELLGGTAGTFTPLASLSEDGNRILRQCLTPGRSYPTGRDFYNALNALPDLSSTPVTLGQPIQPLPVTPSRPSPAPVVPSGDARSIPRPKNRPLLILLGLLTMLVAAGLGWIFLANSSHPGSSPVVATPQPTSTKIVAARSPPQSGQSWTNTLEMRFVPLGNIHVAVWQTRLRDFNAFVEATSYDAVGGMSSVIVANGFKLNAMSWKNPGFAQTPEHPVVGVSWEDANQFCAWLTRKERSEGALTHFQSYRMPTDLEWSAIVGLPREQGATPEDRSGKIKGIYPWGTDFPPPIDSANYAGSESSVDAPATWAVIPGFHDAFPRTAPVTAFPPNGRGLCSVGGNVWEWCLDKYNRTMNWRTLRGGSWSTSRPEETLSSFRRGYDPLFRSDNVGFRCVIAPDGGQQ
ncbi:MAG TPA: SUMF1/EgtB/PvdO family nonheme iron enzyme [Chthoniobacterales bacterium]|nr:SUMF1/EgtB/PvdO family nonheme iron enzyme [Chthoniobacterales bacterium]